MTLGREGNRNVQNFPSFGRLLLQIDMAEIVVHKASVCARFARLWLLFGESSQRDARLEASCSRSLWGRAGRLIFPMRGLPRSILGLLPAPIAQKNLPFGDTGKFVPLPRER